MRILVFAFPLALLAACGVDGPPQPPGQNDTPPAGVSLSGEVTLGVGGNL
ncbi:hypothetical protein [Rhodobacter maris]|uniref:Argininosuccinate lyase n=1 Tax=Rhodobacter maris TaxID=446682 RepID=A0A285RQ14_9RHOB|nr:hypothetical protein [Rhodobacter maris]SOB94502.1 hypothetical protein SAMN05877831_101482 [Rhodobacter maris]